MLVLQWELLNAVAPDASSTCNAGSFGCRRNWRTKRLALLKYRESETLAIFSLTIGMPKKHLYIFAASGSDGMQYWSTSIFADPLFVFFILERRGGV